MPEENWIFGVSAFLRGVNGEKRFRKRERKFKEKQENQVGEVMAGWKEPEIPGMFTGNAQGKM